MSQSATEERIEAVIISGPRKGEIISIINDETEPQLSPEEEAMLDVIAVNAQQLAENMREARIEAEALLEELREVNKKHYGVLGKAGRGSQVTNHNGHGSQTAKRSPKRNSSPVARTRRDSAKA